MACLAYPLNRLVCTAPAASYRSYVLAACGCPATFFSCQLVLHLHLQQSAGFLTCLRLSLVSCWQFVEFAKVVCERLEALGHWADYIDPCRCVRLRIGRDGTVVNFT